MDTTADLIPARFETDVSIGELINNKINRMLKQYDRIAIGYSGGIDSSSVLCGFLKNLHPNEYDRIIVIGSQDSIDENPGLWRRIKNTKVDARIVDPTDVSDTLRNVDADIITTGWQGDQLFYGDTAGKYSETYFMPWVDGLSIVAKDKFGIDLTNDQKYQANQVWQTAFDAFDLPVKTYAQLCWFTNFCCRWNHNTMYCNMLYYGSKNWGRVDCFFDDIEFQRWSVSNFENNFKHNGFANPAYLKRPLKTYIHEFTYDIDYMRNKNKVESFIKTKINPFQYNDPIYCLTNEGLKKFTPQSESKFRRVDFALKVYSYFLK